MALIKPFRAYIYNQAKIKSLSHVICPPYDIISSRKQEYFHDLDAHNFIHMDLGKDIPGDDKYLRAANYFQQWIKDEVLVRDTQPAIYFYSHQYWVNREKKVRLGFLALLKLQEHKHSVFGHEHTRLEPKEDRLKLIREVKANLSPIFVVFADKKRLVNQLWNNYVQNIKPFVDIADEDGNVHKVWRISDEKTLDKVRSLMETESMFIADGHHRYEVSCTYRDEMKKIMPSFTGEEPFNYTLTYFTNIDPAGLTILPIHRLVKLDQALDIGLGLFNALTNLDFLLPGEQWDLAHLVHVHPHRVVQNLQSAVLFLLRFGRLSPLYFRVIHYLDVEIAQLRVKLVQVRR